MAYFMAMTLLAENAGRRGALPVDAGGLEPADGGEMRRRRAAVGD